jgi:cell division protease FtsH
MRKALIFIKLYWLRIILFILLIVFVVSTSIYMKYCIDNYGLLENFSKRQISGQMAALFPMFFLVQAFSIPLFMFANYFAMRGFMFGNVGRERHLKANVNVKWADVIGMEEAKREAWELVKLLKDRALVKAIGGKIIKGTLMVGPPGCGKTYLAKAIASECGLPLISAVGSEFIGMFVGQGGAQIKSLFKQARALANLEGGCLIFIDEIDSFARPRQADMGFGGGVSDRNSTINQFLTEIDGLRKAENNIVIIAATNVPENELDPAIMRSGRFDRKIYISRPNLDERKALFQFYLSRVKTDGGIDPSLLARKALYFTPADIDNMIREAGLIALRAHRDIINNKDLSEGYDRIAFGMKSNIILTKEEKIWTAYHETGHAVIAYLLHPTNDVVKASIVPHKGMLGFVSQRPSEEMHSSNRDHLLADIKVSVASYVAETMKFGRTSSGVGGGPGSDFYHAMSVARNMVWRYGMGKSGLLGDFYSMGSLSGSSSELSISEKTKEKLDEDVQHILQSCMKEVEEVLAKNKNLFEEFAQTLLAKGELEYDEIVAIFNKYGLQPVPRSLEGGTPVNM